MELTPSAPLLAHYSEDTYPPLDPPLAPPLAPPVIQIAIPIDYTPLAQMPSLNIPTVHTCRSCKSPFNRNEKDNGSSAYFRCLSCQQKMLQTSIIQSCVIH